MSEYFVFFNKNRLICVQKDSDYITRSPAISKTSFMKRIVINNLVFSSITIQRFQDLIEQYRYITVHSFKDSSKIISDFPEYFI